MAICPQQESHLKVLTKNPHGTRDFCSKAVHCKADSLVPLARTPEKPVGPRKALYFAGPVLLHCVLEEVAPFSVDWLVAVTFVVASFAQNAFDSLRTVIAILASKDGTAVLFKVFERGFVELCPSEGFGAVSAAVALRITKCAAFRGAAST